MKITYCAFMIAASAGIEALAAAPTLTRIPRYLEPRLECTSRSWSPDGKQIMFVGTPHEEKLRQGRDDDVPPNIWVASADGSQRKLLTNFFFGALNAPKGRKPDPLQAKIAADPWIGGAIAWSPSGKKVAFLAYEGQKLPSIPMLNLYVMNPDGTDIFLVAKDVRANDGTPQWSRDEKKLLYAAADSRPTLIDIEKLKSTALAGPNITGMRACRASPDGKQLAGIASASSPGTGSHFGLCVVGQRPKDLKWLTRANVHGTDPTVLVPYPRAWSPNSKEFLVEAKNGFGEDKQLIVFDVSSGKSRRLPFEGISPTWSPDGKRIAFEGAIDGSCDLYVINTDGTNIQRCTNLTPPGVRMLWGSRPRWSPDGTQLVFRRGQSVWVAKSDGTEQRRVAQGIFPPQRGQNPLWPSDSLPTWKANTAVILAKFVLSGDTSALELQAVALNGDSEKKFNTPDSLTGQDHVSWSADATKVAFSKNESIWVANADGSDARRVCGGYAPKWSPDGNKILFVRGSEHSKALCRTNPDGTNLVQLTDPDAGYNAYHSWSPNGEAIAFEGSRGIYTVSVKGEMLKRVVPGVRQPCWSPDGRKIAFFLDMMPSELEKPAIRNSIHVIDLDTGTIEPVIEVGTSSFGANTVSYLAWSNDGNRLMYQETEDRGRASSRESIWIVDVTKSVFYDASNEIDLRLIREIPD